MNDIFTATFEKHKKLVLESLNDYNWEEKVDWTTFDTPENTSRSFEKLLGLDETKTPQSNTPTTPLILSFPTTEWWEMYDNLPPVIQSSAIEKYKLFLIDSKNPSLHFKPLKHMNGNYWSVDINASYRTVGIKTDIPNGFKIKWIFVGNHNQYDAWRKKK